VQLVGARNDSHLWAETYDRKASDIIQVETEIARNIAERLEAKLTHRETQTVAAQPTSNSAAYELYLKGVTFGIKGIQRDFGRRSNFSRKLPSSFPITRATQLLSRCQLASLTAKTAYIHSLDVRESLTGSA
jgi:hypothetical protein